MKTAFVFFALSILSSSALAAPKISEIRLFDSPGYVAAPVRMNDFVFRSDGAFMWTEGTINKPIRHRYDIGQFDFDKLAAAVEANGFFALKSRYDRRKPTDFMTADGPTVTISVTRAGQTKKVEDYSGFGPLNLWLLEMAVRGMASRSIGLNRIDRFNPRTMPPTGVSVPQKEVKRTSVFTLAGSLKTR